MQLYISWQIIYIIVITKRISWAKLNTLCSWRLCYTITAATVIQMVANFLTKNSLAQNRKILLCGLFVCVTTIVLYCICCKFIAIISLDIIMPFSIGIALLSVWIRSNNQTRKSIHLWITILFRIYMLLL